MNLFSKAGLTYFTTMGGYGFYRGYNGLYKNQLKQKLEYKKNENEGGELYTDKLMSGLGGFLWQTNPIMVFFNLYGIAIRSEKKLRNIKLTPDDYEY